MMGEPMDDQDLLLPIFMDKRTKARKKKLECRLDGVLLGEEEMIDHFLDKHGQEFKKWAAKQS
jgi:hypothetical protein